VRVGLATMKLRGNFSRGIQPSDSSVGLSISFGFVTERRRGNFSKLHGVRRPNVPCNTIRIGV